MLPLQGGAGSIPGQGAKMPHDRVTAQAWRKCLIKVSLGYCDSIGGALAVCKADWNKLKSQNRKGWARGEDWREGSSRQRKQLV